MALLLKPGVFILLPFVLTLVSVSGGNSLLKRQKRTWILAPRQLIENKDYTSYDYIAKIRSDKENFTTITYEITGPGVDQNPKGRFGVNPSNGYVRVYTILDREEIPYYRLKGVAKFLNGSRAENDIDLIIKVVDQNDNPPIITAQQVGKVPEQCAAGTVVMIVNATDADDPSTSHAKIFYRLDEKTNADGFFTINPVTGEVSVAKAGLDRETKDTYRLTVFASDMGGAAGGNTGSGEIEIKVSDINDNIPTLEKESYEGSVEENTVNVEILRVKAVDMDLMYTENWEAAYEITSGNEAGYFSITTDPKTNEGIIMINKALDYEEMKTVNLNVGVSNKAKYNFGSSGATGATPPKSYPVKINVINQKEGPRFQPSVKVVTVSENKDLVSLHKVITTYEAIDSDTLKTATNVRYAKNSDIDNWFSIDENTAEIRLNKLPDRESKFLKNGTYYAEIVCISNDIPSKTATGTIAIQVEDFNDHCPQITATTQTMCFGDNLIYVTAVDHDEFPNSAPFSFSIVEEDKKQNWVVEPLNETTVILRDEAKLWEGIYKVKMVIKDQQGKSCADVQMMDLTVCSCSQDTKNCNMRRKSTAALGAAGVLLLLLGLLLLLLIPCFLLFCLCGNAARDFKPIPFEAQEHLISYHTEGQGEDKEVPLLQVPVNVGAGTINTKDINISGRKGYLSSMVATDGALGAAGGGGATMTGEEMYMYNQYGYSSGQERMGVMGGGTMGGQDRSAFHYKFGAFDGLALSDHYLEQYYSNKSNEASQQYQGMENAQIYNYEGQGSLAGSVGCCSLLENDDDLAFLNDLGPKFKTLAEVCQGETLVSKSVNVDVSNHSIKPVFPVGPSTSSHTHVHTHTETVRDRDRINVSALNTSNVASQSSTVIQEERITERSQGPAPVPKVQVQEKIVIPNQTLLIQQPAMYYAATPMYVVESQPQMVLVSGGTQETVAQVSQAGLSQGILQVGGLQGAQGVVLVEGQVGMGGATGLVGTGGATGLVGTGGATGLVGMGGATGLVGMSGATGQVAQGLSQGTVSESSQVFIVKNGSAGGKHSKHTVRGSGQTGQGSLEAGLDVRGKGAQVKTFSMSSHDSLGSKEDLALKSSPKFQGSKRVVVQQKKVSITERNIGSSSSPDLHV